MIAIEFARHRQPAALALFVVFGASRLTWTGRSIFSVNGDKFLLFEICKPAKGGGRKPEPTIPTSNQGHFSVERAQVSPYLPDAFSPLNVITVLVTCATSFPSVLRMSQTYRLTVFPMCTGFAIARRRSFHTGRKKLICRSRLVKLSPSPKPVACAVPIAASAISQRTPPCTVPIGFACLSRSVTISIVALRSPVSITSKPRVRAMAGGYLNRGLRFMTAFWRAVTASRFRSGCGNTLWLVQHLSARRGEASSGEALAPTKGTVTSNRSAVQPHRRGIETRSSTLRAPFLRREQ